MKPLEICVTDTVVMGTAPVITESTPVLFVWHFSESLACETVWTPSLARAPSYSYYQTNSQLA